MTQQEKIDYIRLRLGNIPSTILPDTVILAFLTVRESQYPTDEPSQLYYTIVDCVNYLIAFYTNQGNAKTAYAQEGTLQVSLSNVDYVKSWSDWLKDFKNNPNIVGLDKSISIVYVGGVYKPEVDRINNDSNSVNGKVSSFYKDIL